MSREQYYRRLGRVEDRAEKCIVNQGFTHFCVKHHQPVCANTKPRHCAWQGALTTSTISMEVRVDGSRTSSYHLKPGNKYCDECIGTVLEAYKAFVMMGEGGMKFMTLRKHSPAEIQEIRERNDKELLQREEAKKELLANPQ